MKKTTIAILAALPALAMTSAFTGTASAKEAVLRGVSCFPAKSFFSGRFERFVEEVNKAGKGQVRINYVGGAPAIGSPFTLVQRVSRGAFDIASCTGAYYQNVVPEADAWKLLERTPAEIRANGGWSLMNKIHNAKNLHALARVHYGTPFHLYLAAGKKISKPDLKGLHLRVAPIYRNFFQALGATTQRSNLAQVYTLMENKTVAGYGWPITGLRPGWEKVTKYRVDPGFYDADIEFVMNLRAFRRLSPAAQKLITDIAVKFEAEGVAQDAKMVAAARKKQAEYGFEVINFTGADRAKWLKVASDAGWGGVIKVSPKNGPLLRKYFTK